MYRIIFFLVFLSFSGATKAQYFLEQAKMALADDNFKQAYDYLNQELADNPQNGEAWLIRAAIHHDHNFTADALGDVNKAIKYLSDSDTALKCSAYNLRASAYIKIDETDKALADFTRAIELLPGHAETYNSRGALYYDLKDFAKAEADHRRALAISDADYEAYTYLGRLYAYQEKYPEAENFLTQALKLNEQLPMALYFRSQVYYHQEKNDEAITDIFNCMDQARSDMDVRVLFMQYSLKNTPLAIAKINSRLETDEDKVYWLYIRANAQKTAGNFQEAINDLTLGIKDADNEVKSILLNERGMIYNELARPKTALADFSKALSVADNVNSYLHSAIANSQMGNIKEAEAAFSKVIEKEPEAMVAYFNRGYMYELLKKPDLALKDYEYAVSLNKNCMYARMMRGKLFKTIYGDTARANEDFRTVILCDTVILESLNARQYAFYHMGRFDEAVAWNEKILEKYPVAENYYQSCCLYSLLNKKEEALNALKQGLELSYVDFLYIRNDPNLIAFSSTPEWKQLVRQYEEKHLQKYKNIK